MLGKATTILIAAVVVLAIALAAVALAAPRHSGSTMPMRAQSGMDMMSGKQHSRAMRRIMRGAGMKKADVRAMIRACRKMMEDHEAMMGEGGSMMGGGSTPGSMMR